MVFLKTKNIRPKRLFLIVLSLFIVNGGIVAVLANQITSSTVVEDTTLVKDDLVLAEDVNQLEETGHSESIITQDEKPLITTYTVQSGDTVGAIASKFNISTNTLLWANDLTKKSTIKEGQKLTILPVSGVIYTVAKGNTLGGIALKFDANVDEIIAFNDLEDNKPIKVGMKIIIPNAQLPIEKITEPAKVVIAKAPVKTEVKKVASVKVSEPEKQEVKVVVQKEEVVEKEAETEKEVSEEKLTHPIPGSILTQGSHGYNSVDFGAPVGTKVYAALSGKVVISKGSGYNGGYGEYIVIEHSNGTQTLYAHLSSVLVSEGDEISKGKNIALSGNTGRSTGPHLHFEVRGGNNPWTAFKKLTHF